MYNSNKISLKNISQYTIYFVTICTLIITLLAFIFPLGAAISPLLGETLNQTNYSFIEIIKIISFTFIQSLLSVFVSLIIGVIAAYFVSQYKFPGKRLLLAASSVPLCIPTLLVALGYVSTFGMSGFVNRILMKSFSLSEPPLTFLYSLTGIVIAQGFYNFPLVMLTVADCWKSISNKQHESALLLGASKGRIFFTITIPELLPSIISSCIPVFIYCFFSFMIVLLFGATGCTTLEVAVYHSARSMLNYSNAALFALIETMCALLMIFIYSIIENKSLKNKSVSYTKKFNAKRKLNRKTIFPFLLFIIPVILFFVIPILSILVSSFTVRRLYSTTFTLSVWKKLFSLKSFYPAVITTFTTAISVSIVSTCSAFVYATFYRIKDPYSKNIFLRTLPLLPMAVSSVVMGLGITILVHRGSQLSLILAESALAWPFAFRQIYSSLIKIPEPVLDSARLLSCNKLDYIYRICIPYSKFGIISSLGFCFAISAGDTALPLVLAIPKFDTLALFTYRLAGSHKFNEACAAGMILGLICIIIFSISNKIKDK